MWYCARCSSMVPCFLQANAGQHRQCQWPCPVNAGRSYLILTTWIYETGMSSTGRKSRLHLQIPYKCPRLSFQFNSSQCILPSHHSGKFHVTTSCPLSPTDHEYMGIWRYSTSPVWWNSQSDKHDHLAYARKFRKQHNKPFYSKKLFPDDRHSAEKYHIVSFLWHTSAQHAISEYNGLSENFFST